MATSFVRVWNQERKIFFVSVNVYNNNNWKTTCKLFTIRTTNITTCEVITVLPQWCLGHASLYDRLVWSVYRQCSQQLSVQCSGDSVYCMAYTRQWLRRSNSPQNSLTHTCCPRAGADTACRMTGRDHCTYDTPRDTSDNPNSTVSIFICLQITN